MKTFEGIKFKWTFRAYQQRVLDNSQKFINDGKVNIVAAPGSGKTILGLELIRRLNNPCLILSPTTTIKQQWGDRFVEAYMPEKEKVEDYVSFNLNEIKLLNSITYQALHSAMDKIAVENEEEKVDYSNIDLFKLIIENNIKTICLDEAHHLQNEWQKALEKFISGLGEEVKIIALTATPPYDASPVEWGRYVSVCGEIDDEIFVPELVKEKTLCPHQDYILLNYPTQKEVEQFKNHRLSAFNAIEEISKLEFVDNLNKKIEEVNKHLNDYFYAKYKEFTSVFIFLNYCKKEINKGLFKKISFKKEIPELDLITAEQALQFMLEDTYLLTVEQKELLTDILKQHSLFNRKKVTLDLNEKLKKSLVSSTGKLTSIIKIVDAEKQVLNNKLRMLVLTDYIKKESSVNIGKDVKIDNISVVSIFEEIRKNNKDINVGCLSGSLVILPLTVKEILDKQKEECSVKPIENTVYGIYNFKGGNKHKVNIVSKLFEEGYIQILVGTQSLLGEGWDSPCINSLILASYVGSFMLSNQMRGRAIRIFKKDKDKTANIWHLVTIEPEYIFNLKPETKIENVESKENKVETKTEEIKKELDVKVAQENELNVKIEKLNNANKENIQSADFDTLKRRFNCFVGPNYDTNQIESGVERVTYICPPYTQENVENINNKIIEKAKDRQGLIDSWNIAVKNNTETVIENRVSSCLKIPAFTFYNILSLIVTFVLTMGLCVLDYFIFNLNTQKFFVLLLFVASCGLTLFMFLQFLKVLSFILKHRTATSSFKHIGLATLKALKSLGHIEDKAKLNIKEDKKNKDICLSIKKASIHEQNTFNEAIKQLLTKIEKPKYLMVKIKLFKFYDYSCSFACPEIFEKNSNVVSVFKHFFKKVVGKVEAKFTFNDKGRKFLVKCAKKSYISKNYKEIFKRQKVDKN